MRLFTDTAVHADPSKRPDLNRGLFVRYRFLYRRQTQATPHFTAKGEPRRQAVAQAKSLRPLQSFAHEESDKPYDPSKPRPPSPRLPRKEPAVANLDIAALRAKAKK
jgi:hypothetical protein